MFLINSDYYLLENMPGRGGRGSRGGGGRGGRGRGRGRGVVLEEPPEQRAQREEKERIEAKKYHLIDLVREKPVLFDTAHPDHLNNAITSVLWNEIADILEEPGK